MKKLRSEQRLCTCKKDRSTKVNDVLVKSNVEPKVELNNKECGSAVVENLLNTSKDNSEETIKSSEVENIQTVIDTPGANIENKKVLPSENSSIRNTSTINNSDKSADALLFPSSETSLTESASASTSDNISSNVENLREQYREEELIDDAKPIVEEPCSKDDTTKNFSEGKDSLTITEAAEEETRVIKSIVPDRSNSYCRRTERCRSCKCNGRGRFAGS